jgi:hypothetical protein
VPGIFFLRNKSSLSQEVMIWLRDGRVALVLMGLGSAWFLNNVLNLREADFGDYKYHLFAFFGAVAVGSWFFARDFLGVRGGAILVLLLAELFLRSVFGHYEAPQRLVLVSGCYLAIVAALYFGALPYRLRDFFEWLLARSNRPRLCGAGFVVYGLALLLTAFSY